MNFMKLFQKMVTLLYKMDVLSEDAIITWYKTGHMAKGKKKHPRQKVLHETARTYKNVDNFWTPDVSRIGSYKITHVS